MYKKGGTGTNVDKNNLNNKKEYCFNLCSKFFKYFYTNQIYFHKLHLSQNHINLHHQLIYAGTGIEEG